MGGIKISEQGRLVLWLAQNMRGANPAADGAPHLDTYVEIGVGKGTTFNHVAPLARRAVGVDWKMMGRVLRAPNVELYEMKASAFVNVWHDPIDLLFIDANHNYPAVKHDFEHFAPFVKTHTGLIVLHDTYPVNYAYASKGYGMQSCWRFADEVRRLPQYAEYEIVTLPVQICGLSIIRRAPTHMDWVYPEREKRKRRDVKEAEKGHLPSPADCGQPGTA